MLSAMDDAVGSVLAKIRELGQEKNTLIFFLSDNGGPTAQTTSGNGPLRGFKGQAPGLITRQPARGLTAGCDNGPVGDYATPNVFTGKIENVRVQFLSGP